MSKTVTQLLSVAAAAALVCATGCARRKGSEELAARLVKVSELHVAYAAAYAAGFSDSASRDGMPGKEIDCVTSKITPELTQPALVDTYSAEFTDEEMGQAIAFFGSETGQAYSRHEQMVLMEMIGRPADRARDISPAEAERVDAFLGTRIGSQLLHPDSPVAAASRAKIRPTILAFVKQCMGAR